MSAGRAHLAEVDRLMFEAFGEAEGLGYRWVGPEDFVLAILASKDRSPARVALEGCGLEHDAFADALKR